MMDAARSSLPLRPCVGVMLLNLEGRVWVGRRISKKDAEGAGRGWQMPQGGIDPGEEPEAAAIRELREETGITSAKLLFRAKDWLSYELPSHLVGKAWGGRYRGQRQMWYAAKFEGEDGEIDLAGNPKHKPEFDAWRWCDLSELPNLIVPFKRRIYEALVLEFTPLIGERLAR